MRKPYSKALLTAALLATSALAAPAFAQDAMSETIPPNRQQLDENGVNWATGGLVSYKTELSIGAPGREGLQYVLAHGHLQSNSNWTLSVYGDASTSVDVVVGFRRITFNNVGGTLVPNDGSGATLTANADQTQYTLTLDDGTVVVYDNFGRYDTTKARGTSITYPTGEKITLAYNTISWCTTLLDSCDTYGYAMRLQSVTSSVGYQLHYTYVRDDITLPNQSNGWKHLVSVTAINTTVDPCDPSAGTCTYTQSWPSVSFDSAGGVTDALGNKTTYTDSQYQFTVQRPSASSPDFVANFDTNQRPTSITRDGDTWTYAFTPGSGTMSATRTDPLGHVTTVISNTTVGLPTSVTDGRGKTTTYTYNSKSQLTRTTYQEGNHTDYAYDGRGNVTKTTFYPKSGTGTISTSAVYPSTCSGAACNEPTSTTDANGNVTDYTYNADGQLLTVTAPAPVAGAVRPQTRYTYANVTTPGGTVVSKLKTVSQCQKNASCAGTADEGKTTYNWSSQLLQTSVTKASGDGALSATTMIGHDNIGNVASVDGPLAGTGDTTVARYDLDGNVLRTISPDSDGAGSLKNRAVSYTYNSDGNVSQVQLGTVNSQSDSDWSTFAPLQTVTVGYDSYGRPITKKLSAGGTDYALTQTDYNSVGQVRCTAVRMNTADYDSLRTSACNQGSDGTDQIMRVNYDAAGNPNQYLVGVGTTAAATERTLTYTGNGKLETLTDTNNNTTTYSYDAYDRLTKITYPDGTHEDLTPDANGNVTTFDTRAGQSIGFSYDALNRMTHKGGSIDDRDYTYDNLGRMLTATFSTGGQGVTNTYDALGRLTSSTSNMGGTPRAMSYGYDSAGRRTKLTYPDGYYLNYDYLVTGEVSKIRENGATSGLGVLATYTYDNLGNRTRLTLGNGVVTNYAMDPVSRLSSLTHDLAGTANDLTKTFAYDPASQITSETRSNNAYAWNGAVNINRGYTVNNLNQYTAAGTTSFTYDANGNLTSDGTNSFDYDAENELTTATIAGIAAHLHYDPLGRLAQLTGTDVSDRTFVYAGLHAAVEYSSAGVIRGRYVFGPGADEPLLQYDNNGVRTWYTADERGSIVGNSNDAGALTGINSYDEYGIPGSTNSGRFQYTGQMWIGELGMYFYKSRAYSPTLGRFLQTDPIGYGDGMNWYAYTHNDPVNGSDPFGLDDLACPAGATGPQRIDASKPCTTQMSGGMLDGQNRRLVGGSNPDLFSNWLGVYDYDAMGQVNYISVNPAAFNSSPFGLDAPGLGERLSGRADDSNSAQSRPAYCRSQIYQFANDVDRLGAWAQGAVLSAGVLGQAEPYAVARSAFGKGAIAAYDYIAFARFGANVVKAAYGDYGSGVADVTFNVLGKAVGGDELVKTLGEFGLDIGTDAFMESPCE